MVDLPDISTLSDEQIKSLPLETRKALWARYNPPSAASGLEDAARGGLTGLTEAGIGLAGLPTDALELAGNTVNKLGLGAPQKAPQQDPYKIPASTGPSALSSAGIQQAYENRFGPLYQPKTETGKFLRLGGNFLPALAGPAGGESLASRAVTRVAAPALGSQVAQDSLKGTAAEPYAPYIGAAFANPALRLGARGITPLPADPAHVTMARALENRGIPVSAGQFTDRPSLQRYEGKPAGQQEAYNRAALGEMDVNASKGLPQFVNPAVLRMQKKYEDIGSRNNLNWDRQLSDEIIDTAQKYGSQFSQEQKASFQKHVDDLYGQYGNSIPGGAYLEKRSALSRLSKTTMGSDPTTAIALGDLKRSLDAAFERSLASANSPDLGALKKLNRQWEAWKTLAPALKITSEAGARGDISPQNLATSVTARDNEGAVRGRTRTDLPDLAREGQAVLNTPERKTIGEHMPWPTILGALFGGGAAYGTGGGIESGVLGSLVGGPSAAIGARMAHPLVTSGPAQAYLKNQIMAPWLHQQSPATQTAIMSAILASPQSRLKSAEGTQ